MTTLPFDEDYGNRLLGDDINAVNTAEEQVIYIPTEYMEYGGMGGESYVRCDCGCSVLSAPRRHKPGCEFRYL